MTGIRWLARNKFSQESELELARRLLQGLCIIPASGEFIYDTVEVVNGSGSSENKHRPGSTKTDFANSVDDIATYLPRAKTVNLVCAWFGNDLRMSQCLIRPGAENSVKTTTPYSWKVGDRVRSNAYILSQDGTGNPYFGGTPTDLSIVRAIRYLKSKGISVVFYPFMMMDIQPGNSLPDPYSSNSYQPQQPWRGMITTDKHLSMGAGVTTDKTSAVTTHVNNFFGNCNASDITCSVDLTTSAVTYSLGSWTPDWRYRYHILHYAKLCAAINTVEPGAVKAFMVGTEMREMLCVRDASNNFPGVTALNTLINDCKSVLGSSVEVSYASDWSECTGYKPSDNSGFWHHLDPIWSNPNVSFIGIDNYFPISDWRDGTTHIDYAVAGGNIYNQAYLQGNIEGGELYDWEYYSNPVRPTDTGYASWYTPPQPTNDRNSQTRHTIVDPQGLGKAWVFRKKDLRNWWLNQHYNRPSNVESGTPTAWVPQSKRIVFTEYGAAKLDRSTNQPNVFPDSRSTQGGLPYYSNDTADKRLAINYYIAWNLYWLPANGRNPISSVYGGNMIDMSMACVWCWDARPYDTFPVDNVWSDGANFEKGHWVEDIFMYPLPDLASRKIFLFLGQSNAEKMFYSEKDRTGTPVTEGATIFKARMAELYGISPSRIVVLRGAVGGTSLLKRMQYKDTNGAGSSGEYHGYWWDEDTNSPSPLALASKTLLASTPGILTGIIWDQGEADYINVDPGNGYRANRKGMQGGGVTVAQYKAAFAAFVSWLRSSAGLNTNCPILISGIGINVFPSIARMEVTSSGQIIPPDLRSYIFGTEKAQRDAINSITNVYRGPKRVKPNGDYGPEWSTEPELAYDGIHLSGKGYGVQATRLANRMYEILSTPVVWSENSDIISGPNDEFVFVGSSVGNRLFSEWYYTISTLAISSNSATVTCKYQHKLTSSDIGAKGYITTPSMSSSTGFTKVECTLASVPSNTTLVVTTVGAPNLTAMNPGNDAQLVFYCGAQIAKNFMVASKYTGPSQVSLTSFIAEASRFDCESDYLSMNYGSYYSDTGSDYYFGYGRWWNPLANSGAGGPDILAECLGDYLEIRSSAIKGIVIWNGESEAFVESQSRTAANINSVLTQFGVPSALQYTGSDISGYSPSAKYLPRMRQLISYLRNRAGNPNLKIYLVRAAGQIYSGTYYPFSGIISAQTTLATDPNVQICAYPRNSPISGEADIPIDSANSNVCFTCKGYQDIGTRIANGIVNNIVFPQYYVGYSGQSNAQNMFASLANENGVLQDPASGVLQTAVATAMSVSVNAVNVFNGAKGGSALLKIMEAGDDSSSTNGYWWDDDTDTPGVLATNFVANAGNSMQVILWDQGEADYLTANYRKYMTDSRYSRGEGMLGNSISMDRYKNALINLFAWFRSASGFNKPNLPILIVGPGYAETPNVNEIAAGTLSIPEYAYAMIGLEKIHRDVANSVNNVFLTFKKFRPKGDYGPEWPTQPKLSNDGIHYFGGTNGYYKIANAIAADVAGILNGTKTWTSNLETTISGPDNEIVILGSFNGITTGSRFIHKVSSWNITSNYLSVTVAAPAHNFGSATVGLQVVFTSETGTIYSGTIDQNTSANTIRFPYTASNTSGTGGYLQIKLGDQIIKDTITSYKSWTANQLSVVNFGIFASKLDERMDDIIKGKSGSDSDPSRSIGTWINSNNTLSMLGEATLSYLTTRGSAIKALVLNFGEFEYLYRNAAGGTILITGTGTINVAQGAIITLSNGKQLQTSRSYTIYDSGIIYVATTDANQGSDSTYADACVTASGVSVTRTSGFTGTITSSVTTGNGIYRVTMTDLQTRYKQFIQQIRTVLPSVKIFLNKPGNTWYAGNEFLMTEARTVIDNLVSDTSIDPCYLGADMAMPLNYMKPADFGPSGTAYEWNPRATQQVAISIADILKTNI